MDEYYDQLAEDYHDYCDVVDGLCKNEEES